MLFENKVMDVGIEGRFSCGLDKTKHDFVSQHTILSFASDEILTRFCSDPSFEYLHTALP